MTNTWKKKEYPQFSLKWTRFDYQKPPRTGYYFRKACGVIDVIYYNAESHVVVMFGEDYSTAVEMRDIGFDLDFWAKMPRIPMSKILYNGMIEIV